MPCVSTVACCRTKLCLLCLNILDVCDGVFASGIHSRVTFSALTETNGQTSKSVYVFTVVHNLEIIFFKCESTC